jgi:hypothetical protein
MMLKRLSQSNLKIILGFATGRMSDRELLKQSLVLQLKKEQLVLEDVPSYLLMSKLPKLKELRILVVRKNALSTPGFTLFGC